MDPAQNIIKIINKTVDKIITATDFFAYSSIKELSEYTYSIVSQKQIYLDSLYFDANRSDKQDKIL